MTLQASNFEFILQIMRVFISILLACHEVFYLKEIISETEGESSVPILLKPALNTLYAIQNGKHGVLLVSSDSLLPL